MRRWSHRDRRRRRCAPEIDCRSLRSPFRRTARLAWLRTETGTAASASQEWFSRADGCPTRRPHSTVGHRVWRRCGPCSSSGRSEHDVARRSRKSFAAIHRREFVPRDHRRAICPCRCLSRWQASASSTTRGGSGSVRAAHDLPSCGAGRRRSVAAAATVGPMTGSARGFDGRLSGRSAGEAGASRTNQAPIIPAMRAAYSGK